MEDKNDVLSRDRFSWDFAFCVFSRTTNKIPGINLFQLHGIFHLFALERKLSANSEQEVGALSELKFGPKLKIDNERGKRQMTTQSVMV